MHTPTRIIRLIKKHIQSFTIPSVTAFSERNDPYLVLISCILSLRTKDKTTTEASIRLFKLALTPLAMVKLSALDIQRVIYPVGFYRTKSKVILDISKTILKEHKGKVPDSVGTLLRFKGVGRKTANLVLGLGYKIPAVCVDTHVHRIANRLGWVRTRTPEETERELEKIIPRKYWIELNTLLVTFGQNLCVPISPHCSACVVKAECKRRNVASSR